MKQIFCRGSGPERRHDFSFESARTPGKVGMMDPTRRVAITGRSSATWA